MSETREDRIARYAVLPASELARALVSSEDAVDAREQRIAALEAALRDESTR